MARIPIDVEEEMNAPQPPQSSKLDTTTKPPSAIDALKEAKARLIREGRFADAYVIDKRIKELEGSSQNNLTEPPMEQVTAEPTTENQSDGTVDDPPPKPVSSPTAPTAGLQTQAPIVSASEPDSSKLEMPMEETPKPEIDETEQLMGEYRKAREQYQSDVDTLEQDREASEASRQRMTGIAGALSSFGEGLAAITGGSAKPLQAGVAAVKGMGEQQAASEERKAKTLKERLQMAKAPLEEKQTEIDLRSRISKGKMERDLMDPASQQSAQARKDAGAFIDNMIAQGTANSASPDVLQRLEQTKSLIGQMSAAQVQQFYNTLKPLSTETSVDAKNKFDMDKLAAQESMKLKLAEAKDSKDQQRIADKEFLKVRSKIADEETAAAKVGPQMEKFMKDLNAAVAGDKEAAKRVSQNYGVVNYLNARAYEGKGVFTDKDLAALSQLDAGRTWFQQLEDFVSKGMNGTIPKEALIRVQGVMNENIDKFREPGKFIRANYAQTFREIENPAMNRYADVILRGEEAAKPKTAVQQPAQTPQPPIETAPKMIKVKLNGTNQTGTIPENEFDPKIYERI